MSAAHFPLKVVTDCFIRELYCRVQWPMVMSGCRGQWSYSLLTPAGPHQSPPSGVLVTSLKLQWSLDTWEHWDSQSTTCSPSRLSVVNQESVQVFAYSQQRTLKSLSIQTWTDYFWSQILDEKWAAQPRNDFLCFQLPARLSIVRL